VRPLTGTLGRPKAGLIGIDGVEFNLHRAGPTEGHAGMKQLLDDLGLKVIIQ
jgi:hypothetical protein